MKKDPYHILLEEIAEQCVEDESAYQLQATALKSAAAIRKEKKLQIMDFIENGPVRPHIQRALKFLKSEPASFLTEEQCKDIKNSLDKIEHFAWEKLQEPKDSTKDPDQLEIFQEIFGLSNESLINIYRVGFHFYEEQHYEDALDIFMFLFILNPTVADFSYELGLCYKQLNNLTDALGSFILAANLNIEHVGANLGAASCFIDLHDKDQAKKHLDHVRLLGENSPEKIEGWLENINSIQACL